MNFIKKHKFIQMMIHGVISSFVGIIAGALLGILIYFIQELVIFIEPGETRDILYPNLSFPVSLGAGLGAMIGAIFGAVFGVKEKSSK